jgi:hypothetical protein
MKAIRALGQRDRCAPLAVRFENRITRGVGCWEWQGNINPVSGYGRLQFEKQMLFAHRVAYELYVGPIPEGMVICHHCDNPPCVRPDHLFLGTHADNVADKMNKGRWAGGSKPGEAHHNSILTDEQVAAIRAALRQPLRHGDVRKIARQYNVDESTIHHIKSGRAWRHIP